MAAAALTFYHSPAIATALRQLDHHLPLVQRELHQILAPLSAKVEALKARCIAFETEQKIPLLREARLQARKQFPEYEKIKKQWDKAIEDDGNVIRRKIRFLQGYLKVLANEVEQFKRGEIVLKMHIPDQFESLSNPLRIICPPVPAEVSKLADLRINLINCLADKINTLFKIAVYQRNIQNPTEQVQAIALAQKDADHTDKIVKTLEQEIKALESSAPEEVKEGT